MNKLDIAKLSAREIKELERLIEANLKIGSYKELASYSKIKRKTRGAEE